MLCQKCSYKYPLPLKGLPNMWEMDWERCPSACRTIWSDLRRSSKQIGKTQERRSIAGHTRLSPSTHAVRGSIGEDTSDHTHGRREAQYMNRASLKAASRLLTKSFGGMLAAPERSQYGRTDVSSHYRQMPHQMTNCNDLRTNLKAAVSLVGTPFPWPASSLSTAC